MYARAQANVLAVALGVSIIIILLLSTAYLLSSTSVRTSRILELLSEQSRVVMYINGTGYLVGNAQPEYIVVKDSSGNIKVYLAGELGVGLGEKFPQLSGIVYGVSANGAVRLLKPAPWLLTNTTSVGGVVLEVWPGWLYSHRPLVPYNNTSWISVSSSRITELMAQAGYLNATTTSRLYLVATVNFTETSIGWRTWKITFNSTSWTRSSPIYAHVILSTPGYTLFRIYSLEDVVFNVYACNYTSCTSIGSYSVPARQYTNVSVLTGYPYILFNVSVVRRPLWPNWTFIEIYTSASTWFSNKTIKPQSIIDAVTQSTTTLPTLSCSNYSKAPVLNPYPFTEDTLLYYEVYCGKVFAWVNVSEYNLHVIGEYVFTAPKPVVVVDKAVVVNATKYPVNIGLALPPTSTITLKIEYNITPWIGPAQGAYIYLKVFVNGIELFNDSGSTTPLTPYRFNTVFSIAGYRFNLEATSRYTPTAIVSELYVNVSMDRVLALVLVPSMNANVTGDLYNISQYKTLAWREATISTRFRGSKIITIILSQN